MQTNGKKSKTSNLFLPHGLGHDGDDRDDEGRERDGQRGVVEEGDVAHHGLDPLGPGVGQAGPAGGLGVAKLEEETDHAHQEAGEEAPECALEVKKGAIVFGASIWNKFQFLTFMKPLSLHQHPPYLSIC